MYGAILGDIAGSRFEFSRPQNFDWKTTDFFGGMSAYTDDTVLTVATKYAVLTGTPYAKAYSIFGKRYNRVGYGTMFKKWLNSSSQKGYNSYGNGAAMRVSYIGWHFPTLEEVEEQACLSALVTHNPGRGESRPGHGGCGVPGPHWLYQKRDPAVFSQKVRVCHLHALDAVPAF